MRSAITLCVSSTGEEAQRRIREVRSMGFRSTSAVLLAWVFDVFARAQLLEHMRLAQEDMLDFCINPNYTHNLKWPDDYWPAAAPSNDAAWKESILSFAKSREKMKALASDVPDLTAKRSHRQRQPDRTCVPILLVADHTAYHVGQLRRRPSRARHLALEGLGASRLLQIPVHSLFDTGIHLHRRLVIERQRLHHHDDADPLGRIDEEVRVEDTGPCPGPPARRFGNCSAAS